MSGCHSWGCVDLNEIYYGKLPSAAYGVCLRIPKRRVLDGSEPSGTSLMQAARLTTHTLQRRFVAPTSQISEQRLRQPRTGLHLNLRVALDMAKPRWSDQTVWQALSTGFKPDRMPVTTECVPVGLVC